jgi:hypothetical protein
LVALWTFVAVGLFSMLLAPLLRLMVPGEHPFRFDRVIWLATAVLVPTIFVACFNLAVALKSPSPRYALAGWFASAIYHGALTWLFIFFIPATVETSGGNLRVPVSLLSGAAFLASLYLLIRYPRPPRLPSPNESTRIV